MASYTAACQRVAAEGGADDGGSDSDADTWDAEAPTTSGGAGAGAGAGAGGNEASGDATTAPFGAQGAALFHLYWRIGREAGAIKRAMQVSRPSPPAVLKQRLWRDGGVCVVCECVRTTTSAGATTSTTSQSHTATHTPATS